MRQPEQGPRRKAEVVAGLGTETSWNWTEVVATLDATDLCSPRWFQW